MRDEDARPVCGWVHALTAFGMPVGQRWVPWSIGAVARPWEGDYASVEVDAKSYARDMSGCVWRPVEPRPN